MPKFFLPNARHDKQDEFYQTIKKTVGKNMGWKIGDRKIYSIKYRLKGKEYRAEVGKYDAASKEDVIVILESNAYLVCTPNRGILHGAPFLVAKEQVLDIVDFEE